MAEYNPGKQYKWGEEDVFSLKGSQFGLIINAFRSVLSKPEAQEIMLVIKAEAEMTKALIKGVEDGWVEEMNPSDAIERPNDIKPKMNKA